MAYEAARKSGMHRWSPRFRAVLLDDGREVAEVSSLARAEQIAGLLNAASEGNPPAPAETDASYAHYKATTGLDGKRVVLRAEWRGEVEQVLHADDAELLERVGSLPCCSAWSWKVRVHGTVILW